MHVSQDDQYPQSLHIEGGRGGGIFAKHMHVPQDDLYPQRLKQDTQLSPGGVGKVLPTARWSNAALQGAGATVAGMYGGRVQEFSAPTAALYRTPPSPTLPGLSVSLSLSLSFCTPAAALHKTRPSPVWSLLLCITGRVCCI
jgi:hypothetical protein